MSAAGLADAPGRGPGEAKAEAFLGVDEENPSGAMRFYESLGYRATRKDTWHRKWLVEPEGAEESWLY